MAIGTQVDVSANAPPQAVILSPEHIELGYNVALLAGGCFWCLEPPYEKLNGVIEASVGYSGGKAERAHYYLVSNGGTNHLETVRLVYDPAIISYSELLDVYWKFIDPTDDEGQYDDRGSQYTTAIFYTSDGQKRVAEQSKIALAKARKDPRPIVTEILPAMPYYLAEERHQNFYEKRFARVKQVK